LLYGEDNDVWHDARDDTDQQEEETFHDVRDQVEEIQVIKAINGNVTNLEIPGYDRIDPSVFLNDTQDEIRRSVSGIPRMKKVNIILVCMMVKEDPNSKTGERMYRTVYARSRTLKIMRQ
jgi:hypothetical protein